MLNWTAKPRVCWLPWAAVGGATLLGAALRICGAAQPLWVDELHTAWTVSNGLAAVLPRAAIGNQSPLFFYLVWGSTHLLGTSELTVRLSSLVAGILLIPLVFLLIRHWTGSLVAALFGALLAAVEPDLIFYGQEARPYGMVLLVAPMQTALFWHLAVRQRPAGQPRATLVGHLAYVFASAILFYLHYTAALLIIAQLVCYVLVTLAASSAGDRRWLVVDFISIVLLCLPAAGHLTAIAARRHDWQLIVEHWPDARIGHLAAVYLAAPLLIVAGLQLLANAAGVCRQLQRPPRRLLVLVGCWLLVPPALAWLVTITGLAPLAKWRYVIVSWPALVIAAALAVALLAGRWQQLVAAAVVLLAAVATSGVVPQLLRTGRPLADRNEDWPAVVQAVNASGPTSRWPVLLCPGLIEDGALAGSRDDRFRQYCLFPVTALYRVSHEERPLVALPTVAPRRVDQKLARVIARRGGAWLIVRAQLPLARQVADDIRRQLRKAGAEVSIEQRPCGGNVRLFAIVVRVQRPETRVEG